MNLKAVLGNILKVVALFVFGIIIYFLKFPFFQSIVTYFVGVVLIEYIWKNKIMLDRIEYSICSCENGDFFNEEYYNLYYEFNISRGRLLLYSVMFEISIALFISKWLSFNCLIISCVLIIVGTILLALLIEKDKRNNVLVELFLERKQNWFGEYTNEEIEILNKLKDG